MNDKIKVSIIIIILSLIHIFLSIYMFSNFYNDGKSTIVLYMILYMLVGIFLISDFKSYEMYTIAFLTIVITFVSFTQFLLYGVFTDSSMFLGVLLLIANVGGIAYFLMEMQKAMTKGYIDFIDIKPRFYFVLFIVVIVNGLSIFF